MPSFADNYSDTILKVKKFRTEASALTVSKGEVRQFKTFFQGFINNLYPKSEQESDQQILSKDGKESPMWTFEAASQFFAWADFNNDGSDDAIMVIKNPLYCGSVGCPGYIFLSKDDKLESVGNLIVKWDTVLLGGPVISGKKSVYSENECLFWKDKKYVTSFAYPEVNDGETDWNPHNCGTHFSKKILSTNPACKQCHTH